jgi:hypothetical protein
MPFQKGHKIKLGTKHSDATKQKMRFAKLGKINEQASRWKGEKVKLSALHQWVESRLGKPQKCDHCEKLDAKKYEWANKSRLYKRDLSDWLRLCTSCHHKYDDSRKKMWITRHEKVTKLKTIL